jgi:hypothetical protein
VVVHRNAELALLPSVIGSIGWSKRGTESAPDQDYLPPLRRYLEAAGGVALD